METYLINGREVEFDTYDLVNMELFQSQAAELSRLAGEVLSDGENPVAAIRAMCEGVMDFFDLVIGEGTSELCFGSRPNVKVLVEAFRKFVEDVNAETVRFRENNAAAEIPPVHAPDLNREQRRAAERARKRKEAEERLRRKPKDHGA